MTTISWDGKSVAADSMKSGSAYVMRPGTFSKIARRENLVFTFAGTGALFEPMMDWYQAGADPKECPKDRDGGSSALWVFKEGRCFQYTLETPYAEELFPPDAMGAGCDFAVGAMRAGADARRAVEIAAECNPQTGGEIQVVDLTFQKIREAA